LAGLLPLRRNASVRSGKCIEGSKDYERMNLHIVNLFIALSCVALIGLSLFMAGTFVFRHIRHKNPISPPLPQPPSPPPPSIPATVALLKCPQCHLPLAPNAPQGLCPSCLAKVALGSDPVTPVATININQLAGQATPATRVAPDPAQLAAQFPQLEIIELLGMGGMGMVYKARQPRLDRFVALKILPVESQQHPSFAERFGREAKALAKLNHPGIVNIYDFGQTGQYYYFVMEYVDGMNLRHLLHNQPLEPRQALELVTQICTALQFAHDEGVVHRDIKPENILLNKRGQVKIADFGLAKLLGTAPDTALTMSQAAMGTMNYMAPEQRLNAQAVDHRADIYSLGVVFYEMLTGEVPMGRFEAPSKRVQVDVRLDEVVLKALEREPARRYQQVSEVKTGVETITSTMPQQKKGTAALEAFKSQPPPEFAKMVLKAMIGPVFLCLALWFVVPYLACLFGLAFLVAGLSISLLGWRYKEVSQGLRWPQLPPAVRRRGNWRLAAATALSIAAFLVAMATFPIRKTEWREEWFYPNSHLYEKIGLAGNISSYQIPGWNMNSVAASGRMALKIYRKDAPTAMLTFTLPGLRVENDTRDPGQFGKTLRVLDVDGLINWLHDSAGLDVAQRQVEAEARQLMELFESYHNAAPASWDKLTAKAQAALRNFKAGGQKSGAVAEFGGGGPLLCAVVVVPGICVALFYVLAFPMYRRTFAEARAEIEAGRWTPPQVLLFRIPAVFWVLLVLGFITVVLAVEGDFQFKAGALVWILLGLGILVVVLFKLHMRRQLQQYWSQQIQQARERGLWPPSGEAPTLEHVKRLAQAGEKNLAIKLYHQVRNVSCQEARAAVEKFAGDLKSGVENITPTMPREMNAPAAREAFNSQPERGSASFERKTSTLLVWACVLGACAGLVPGISFTGSYWGLKLVYFQIPGYPLTVTGVEGGSPAEQTGFMFGDVFKSMDGATNLHPSSHQAGTVVGEKHTYKVERAGKEVVLNSISTTPQLAAIWFEDISCPIDAALFICIGIVVFATAPLTPPPLWRSISVTIAGLVIAVGLAIATGAATFSDRVAIYQRWAWLDTGQEWYFQQGLIAIAAAVLVTILGAVEIRQRLRKPPQQDAKAPAASTPPTSLDSSQAHLSKAALIGAVWAPWFFLAAFVFGLPSGTVPRIDWLQVVLNISLVPLGLTAPFGTTLLGYVALLKIRHSAGSVYGLGLALLDVLLFPLLLVDGVVVLLSAVVVGFNPQMVGFSCGIGSLISVVLDFFIVRKVWRLYRR
jgi:predicted Ser/Thr protein kinase